MTNGFNGLSDCSHCIIISTDLIILWWITTSGVFQEKIYCFRIADVDELKTRLIDECRAQFDQSIIDAAVSQWRRRLALVSAYTGHTSSVTSDNFKTKLNNLIILLNKPYLGLLCAN